MTATDPSFIDHPLHQEWESRVAALEEEGCSRSDAQAIADMEFSNR